MNLTLNSLGGPSHNFVEVEGCIRGGILIISSIGLKQLFLTMTRKQQDCFPFAVVLFVKG